MRVLELFCGVNKSIGKVAQKLGMEVTSVDINPKACPDICVDILVFDEMQFSKDSFDIIWASPPCESYSLAVARQKVTETRPCYEQTS